MAVEIDRERLDEELVRLSSLRPKLANCIQNRENGSADPSVDSEEAKILMAIWKNFESLEHKIKSYENVRTRRSAYGGDCEVGEIEYTRCNLLSKLRRYKGEKLRDVMEEATLFASTKLMDCFLIDTYCHRFRIVDLNNKNNKGNNKSVADPEREQHPKTVSSWSKGLSSLAGSAVKIAVFLIVVVPVLKNTNLSKQVSR